MTTLWISVNIPIFLNTCATAIPCNINTCRSSRIQIVLLSLVVSENFTALLRKTRARCCAVKQFLQQYDVISALFVPLRPRQNGRHFSDDILGAFSWMKMFEFRIKFHKKFLPKGPINNISALVQIMAWRRPGDKPLSKPMMVSLPTHTCVARPQWVNSTTEVVFICITCRLEYVPVGVVNMFPRLEHWVGIKDPPSPHLRLKTAIVIWIKAWSNLRVWHIDYYRKYLCQTYE